MSCPTIFLQYEYELVSGMSRTEPIMDGDTDSRESNPSQHEHDVKGEWLQCLQALAQLLIVFQQGEN